MSHANSKAFTLIELLIVVAIIAILAAIAVPNFIEAQVRSKASRAKADMRSIATAMEAYRIDANNYPPDTYDYLFYLTPAQQIRFPLKVLTTPVAYITSLPPNPFPNTHPTHGANDPYTYEYAYYGPGYRRYVLTGPTGPPAPPFRDTGLLWLIWSAGPDRKDSQGQNYMWGLEFLLSLHAWGPPLNLNAGAPYDATNGTLSNGDIVRAGP